MRTPSSGSNPFRGQIVIRGVDFDSDVWDAGNQARLANGRRARVGLKNAGNVAEARQNPREQSDGLLMWMQGPAAFRFAIATRPNVMEEVDTVPAIVPRDFGVTAELAESVSTAFAPDEPGANGQTIAVAVGAEQDDVLKSKPRARIKRQIVASDLRTVVELRRARWAKPREVVVVGNAVRRIRDHRVDVAAKRGDDFRRVAAVQSDESVFQPCPCHDVDSTSALPWRKRQPLVFVCPG
jgi:hypothetical protein